ncbi:hypothetical protein N474_15780 [Pseudoalteromonas luteoviolacea CPMOR-2]|uniref:Uncharacterized protein n=1 Tax=Pseudoalteromonas luteoviolacea DSM 6061 TaxID=1365250 RepID=A0A166XRU3_9GAMM|nr:hypothetical protein [Pseudoalteromonas luteoviolacea]KZN40723.1 hypothetical protein N475_11385 [Pseudoalteromonas luteoviolacea DSM 6061]KZN55163.1 hypothetical protein N474_15780 [Pseudoalteromonas luteoviolacea CPMOR-2]
MVRTNRPYFYGATLVGSELCFILFCQTCVHQAPYINPFVVVLFLTLLPIIPLDIDNTAGNVPKVLLDVSSYVEQKQIKLSDTYTNSWIIEPECCCNLCSQLFWVLVFTD